MTATDDIFLSYSRFDGTAAEGLKQQLESFGYSVWMDTEDIRGGHLWRSQIVEGIANCRLYIVMLTANSTESDNVRRELDLARAKNKPILPVYADPKPVHIARDMEYQLVGLQIVHYDRLFKPQAESLLDNLTRTPETLLMPVPEVPMVAVLQRDHESATPLIKAVQVVGRGPGADIDLAPWDQSRFVSKQHAKLQFRDGVWAGDRLDLLAIARRIVGP